jgi:hypothetical protein
VHRLEVGPAYSSALPFSRRLKLAASAGASLVTISTENGQKIVPLAIGSASLTYQIARLWYVGGEYRLEPQMVELYANPTYTNSVAAALHGAFTRRVATTVTGGFSQSKLDAGRGSLADKWMFTTARAQVLITRTLSAYGEYAYYRFDARTPPSVDALRLLAGRNSLRGGLSVAFPLLTAKHQ